jgi:hypothetical protein
MMQRGDRAHNLGDRTKARGSQQTPAAPSPSRCGDRCCRLCRGEAQDAARTRGDHLIRSRCHLRVQRHAHAPLPQSMAKSDDRDWCDPVKVFPSGTFAEHRGTLRATTIAGLVARRTASRRTLAGWKSEGKLLR